MQMQLERVVLLLILLLIVIINFPIHPMIHGALHYNTMQLKMDDNGQYLLLQYRISSPCLLYCPTMRITHPYVQLRFDDRTFISVVIIPAVCRRYHCSYRISRKRIWLHMLVGFRAMIKDLKGVGGIMINSSSLSYFLLSKSQIVMPIFGFVGEIRQS